MKRTIKKMLNLIGIDVLKLRKSQRKKNFISRKSDKLKLHHTDSGKYFLPEEAYHDIVANAIIDNEIFDKEVVEIAKKYIEPGSIALDVGANYGQMSILFSSFVGNEGKVYSFDADDFVFEILKKNIAINNIHNIVPVFGAVHNVADQTLFFPVQDLVKFPSYGSYGIDYTNTQKGREVKTLTIDSLNIKEKISFMKIDIQGGDLFAIKGAIKTIEKNRMPIVFEFEYQFQDDMDLKFQEYVDLVRDIDYYFHKVIGGQNYLILSK
jgi:FkbM family methyltransferase